MLSPLSIRAAIVHDWIPTLGGAEWVLKAIDDSFVDSKVFTVFDFLTKQQQSAFGLKACEISSLNRLPFVDRYYRLLLPLCARAVERFDVSDFDIVVSSSASFAKGVITRAGQPHLAYVHSPARYAWELSHQYLTTSAMTKSTIKRALAAEMLHRFRKWDQRTPNGVDLFIANSKFVSDRIWKVYHRPSVVLYPPVDVSSFALNINERDDYYVTASRLVPYKRVDLIVQAFSQMPNKRLVVVGEGPELKRLQGMAPANVSFDGQLNRTDLIKRIQNAKAFVFAAQEDFGIVPVEAQACGTPVIALSQGGAAETVRPLGSSEQPTGMWFANQNAAEIVAAVERFELEGSDIVATACRKNAELFQRSRFDDSFRSLVAHATSITPGPDFERLMLKRTNHD